MKVSTKQFNFLKIVWFILTFILVFTKFYFPNGTNYNNITILFDLLHFLYTCFLVWIRPKNYDFSLFEKGLIICIIIAIIISLF